MTQWVSIIAGISGRQGLVALEPGQRPRGGQYRRPDPSDSPRATVSTVVNVSLGGARSARPGYLDPNLRISGEVVVPLTVTR